MKTVLKQLGIVVVGFALLLVLASCGGGGDEGENTEAPSPNQPPGMDTEPDQTTLVSLYGTVLDQSSPNFVIPGATIRVTQYSDGVSRILDTITTDDGHYELQISSVVPGRLNVNAETEDFAPQSVIVNLVEGQTSATANLAMVPVDEVRTFQSTDDAEIQNEDHTLVSVAANSLVTQTGGELTGEITAMVTVLDGSSDPNVMPGDFVSPNADTGELEPIELFGAINILFEDENGESLNLRSGQEATISIPLASAVAPEDAPETATLFYWSDENGYWIEQGSASLTQLEGPVTT